MPRKATQNEKISAGLKLAWRRKGPWTFKVRKRKNAGESVILVFRDQRGRRDELFVSRWYPPWQNELMRSNAKLICADLNRAFEQRNNHAS